VENNICIDNTPLTMARVFQILLFSDAGKAKIYLNQFTTEEL